MVYWVKRNTHMSNAGRDHRMKCLLKWIAALAVVAGLLALAAALLCRTREPEEYITLYKDE